MVTGINSHRGSSIEAITRPDPRNHAGQIIAWALCWPWNLLWTLVVYNPLRFVFQFVFREIRSTLDEIATGEFSAIERELSDFECEPSPVVTRHPVGLRPTMTDSIPAPEIMRTETVHARSTIAVTPEATATVPVAEVVGATGDEPAEVTTSPAESVRETELADDPQRADFADRPGWVAPVIPEFPATPQHSGKPDPWFYMPPERSQPDNSSTTSASSDNTASLN